VASQVGFADQSHLIRHFRAAYGVTPGRYARDSRN
jgi:AraC family chemosensory pili system transcriptional regulator ChpD